MLQVHLYGTEPDSVPAATELARKLAAEHGASTARVVWFLGPEAPDGRGTRVQLKDFRTAACPPPDGPVRPFDQWPAQAAGTFAEQLAADGFAFLYEQVQAQAIGPVLTAVVGGWVVGAIDPMKIRPDAIGALQLMPQYFNVLPEHRSEGLGRLLWWAAMHWGQRHGAAYQLLQIEVDGPSDRLCRSEGLASLGFTYWQAA